MRLYRKITRSFVNKAKEGGYVRILIYMYYSLSGQIILLKYAVVSYSFYVKYYQVSYLRQASQEINGALFSQTRQQRECFIFEWR